MRSFDHYPWHPSDEERARVVADICAQLGVIAPPLAPPPAPPFDVRYGVYYCLTCGLALDYCKGHPSPDPPAQDGTESGLARRIRDAQQGR